MDINSEGLVVPRALPPSQWQASVDASELMAEAITWEYGTAFALNYMNDTGAGSHVALVFSLPIDDTDAKVLVIPIDMDQVQQIAMSMIRALAGIYGKTLDEVIEAAVWDIKHGYEGGDEADDVT